MIWPFSRIKALEQRLDDERERNRRREDALLNRILTRNGAFPLLEDELYPEKSDVQTESDLEQHEIDAKLAEFKRDVFDTWATDGGVSDLEREQQWIAYKNTHLDEILST